MILRKNIWEYNGSLPASTSHHVIFALIIASIVTSLSCARHSPHPKTASTLTTPQTRWLQTDDTCQITINEFYKTASPLRIIEARQLHTNSTNFTNISQFNGTSLKTVEATMLLTKNIKRVNDTGLNIKTNSYIQVDISNKTVQPKKPIKNNKKTDTAQEVTAKDIYKPGFFDANSRLCPDLGNTLKVFIAVTSALHHSTDRVAVRKTWGHFGMRKDVAIAFVLGSTTNLNIFEDIKKEQELYGDIIVGKFIDVYDNLTLKTLSILEWVDKYCPNVPFILKTDDDVFINVAHLLEFVDKHKSEKNVIYGRLVKHWHPVRYKWSKYYISPKQYNPEIFPDFTTGPAYLFPARLVKQLYWTALNLTYVKLEDVFITGIVANQLKIKRVDVYHFANQRIVIKPCNVQKAISAHRIKIAELFDMWKLVNEDVKCT